VNERILRELLAKELVSLPKRIERIFLGEAMALCLLPYGSSKLLHRLSSTQHLSSRSFSFSNKSVLAKYRQEGSTSSEGRSDTQLEVSIDHVKLPNKEPCCRNTPLVILPKKPYRRSSRLRVRKGRQYEVKVEAEADVVNAEAEEWVNRVLANNAMVEIDPMTVAEQISAEKLAANPSKGIQVASLTTSARVPDYFPPSNGGFPRISFAMAIAAGSAVVLAILVVLLQPGRKREVASASEVFNQSENLEDAQLKGEFAGERVTKTMQKKSPAASAGKDGGGPRLPHREIIMGDNKFQPDDDEVAKIRLRGAESAAAAAILTTFDFQPNTLRSVLDYSSMPLPPSISKAGFKTDPHPQKASSPKSATPSKNNASVTKPRPTSKYDSVTPFFPSDRSPVSSSSKDNIHAVETVTPFFADEQGTKSYDTVTPFFADEVSQSSTSSESVSAATATEQGTKSYKNVTPFFPDEVSQSNTSSASVAPISVDQQGKKSEEAVTPFFEDEVNRTSNSSDSVALSDANGQGTKSYDTVTPFFPSDLSPVSKPSPSPSPLGRSSKYDSVTPFFPSDRPSVPKQHDLEESKEDITPFFHNEQNMKSDDNVTPFFPSDLSPVSKASPSPSSLDRSSKYDSVTPFFPSDRSSVPKGHDLEVKDVTPFFPDEQKSKSYDNVTPFFPSDLSPVSKASPSPSSLDRSSKYDSVTPFFPSDRSSVPKGHDLEAKDVTPFFPDEQKSKSYDNVTPFFADEINRADSGRLELEGQEEPSMPKELSREELALQAEEERANAKFRALQAAFPALAIGAGAVGALAGVDGAFEMVGLTATASFVSYELLWANSRKALVEELTKITDHKKLFKFLQKRKIIKEC
jgi:hypothetical protein